jgi:hypothetical protein
VKYEQVGTEADAGSAPESLLAQGRMAWLRQAHGPEPVDRPCSPTLGDSETARYPGAQSRLEGNISTLSSGKPSPEPPGGHGPL